MTIWKTPVGAGLLFGTGAALANVFALLPVYGSLSLHFGISLAFLALLTHGLRAALTAAFVSGVGLAWGLDAPSALFFQPLEVLLIGLAVQKRVPLVVAALVYWTVVGLPSSYLVARFGLSVPQDYLLVAVIKQGINGLLNAAIASALFMAFSRSMIAPYGASRGGSLYQQVFSFALVCLVLPSLVLSVMLTNRSVATVAQEVDIRMSQNARDYAAQTQAHIQRHLDVVILIAELHREQGDVSLPLALRKVEARYPGFLTMLIADREGGIEFGVPTAFFERLASASETERQVADRAYFRRPRETGEPYVSEALQGRGFGDDPIVAVSAPLFDDRGNFAGIVEGSLDLPNFARFEKSSDVRQAGVVIVDQSDRVVFASSDLGLAALSQFEPESTSRFSSVPEPQFVINGERFLYRSVQTDRGWQVYALHRSDEINEIIRRGMMLLGLSVGILVLFFLPMSQFMAQRLTLPISDLTRQVQTARERPIRLSGSSVRSREVEALAEALEEARQLASSFRHRLEEEVERKTEALESANQALVQLASEDSLTGLLNRRGFRARGFALIRSAVESDEVVSLALIDVDHFKSVNDRFGHPAGDECLIRFAESLRQVFGRTSDIVARTGGEEFAVLVAGQSCESSLERLEELRASFASTAIEIDGCGSIPVTFSAGFLCQSLHGHVSLDDMIERADALLYSSKRAGRNRVTSNMTDQSG